MLENLSEIIKLTDSSSANMTDIQPSKPIFDLAEEKNLSGFIHHLVNSDVEYNLVWKRVSGNEIRTLIKIPMAWENSDYCRLIIRYFHSNTFKKYSLRHKKTIIQHIQTLFNFLDGLDKNTDPNTSSILFPMYFRHANNTYREYTNYKRRITLRGVLLWAKNEVSRGNTIQYWSDVTRRILRELPNIAPPRSAAMQSATEKANADVDDYDFFIAIRSYCAWFLLKMYNLKEQILSFDQNLKADIMSLVITNGKKEIECSLSNTDLKYNFRNVEVLDLHARLKIAIIEVAKVDLMILEISYIRNYAVWVDTKKFIFKHQKLPEISAETMRNTIKDDFFSLGFSLYELLVPTTSEVFAMNFLLSTERIQSTGQDRLDLGQCKLTPKGVRIIGFEKPRSSSSGKSTAIYANNSIIYDVFTKWKDSMGLFYELNPNHLRFNKLVPITCAQVCDGLKCLSKANIPFYLPLLFKSFSSDCAKFDEPRSKVFIDSSQGNIKPFFSKSKLTCQYRIRVYNRVGSNSIAQSRALIEQSPINILSSMANDELDAGLSAHSPITKKNVYKDRTTSNSILKAGRDFSKEVSKKMIKDANKVSLLLENTILLTVDQVEEKLGYKSQWSKCAEMESLNRVVAEAEKKGYSVGTFAELSHDGKTIVICTSLVAAFIKGEINHIDRNMDILMETNPLKENSYKLRKLFLSEILNNFPKKIVREGDAILLNYDFPFPPLS